MGFPRVSDTEGAGVDSVKMLIRHLIMVGAEEVLCSIRYYPMPGVQNTKHLAIHQSIPRDTGPIIWKAPRVVLYICQVIA